MKKPDACFGCPLYDDGEGFVPDAILAGAKVLVLLQNPGQSEEAKGKPAIGATGEELDSKYLPAAGLERGQDVSIANALRCRWRGPDGQKTNKLPSGKVLDAAISKCRIHDRFPSSSRLCVASGAVAWQAVGGPGKISEWRGFPSPNKFAGMDVLGTLHAADLFRNPKMRVPVLQDWRKVGLYLQGKWPAIVPPHSVNDIAQFRRFVRDAASYVAIDTEYVPDTKYLTCLGLGSPGTDGVQFMGILSPTDRSELRDGLATLVGRLPVVFQNAMADIPVLEKNLGLHYSAYFQVEDTMLAHAVLWSEWEHTLEFLASVYGKHPKMKHLAATNPSLYNWGDVCDTISTQEALTDEFKRDPQSADVYRTQSLALIPIVLERAGKGIRVNAGRVGSAITLYEDKIAQAARLAQAHVGWPINLGSEKQLKQYLYKEQGYPVQIDKDTKKPSIDGDAIAALRAYVGPAPDIEDEEKHGLLLADVFSRLALGADPCLEARVIYAAAQQALSHYIEPCRGVARLYPSFKIHAQASGRWSITDPPLQQLPEDLRDIIIPDEGTAWIAWDWSQIELRLLAALAQDKPYLTAFAKDEDVHSINAQDIFWGTSQEARRIYAEAMLGLPTGVLRSSLSSGDGAMVFQLVQKLAAGVDSALEGTGLIPSSQAQWTARLGASPGGEGWPGRGCTSPQWEQAGQSPIESTDPSLARSARLAAFAAWIVCGGPPPGWEGDHDIRRVFAKRFVYRLNYGGDPKMAGDIPGARQLGLGKKELVDASNRYLTAHPAMAMWRIRVAAEARSTHMSRTFMGRRRRLLGDSRGAVREAYNHPMQGGVADILNLVTVRIKSALPYASLVYTMHDAATWEVPTSRIEEAQQAIAGIVTQEWDVEGMKIRFPAKFKPAQIGEAA